MKVILLEDVKTLGKKGQIIEVNDGYARNFVLPKKLGLEASTKNLNDLKLKQAHAEKLAAEQLEAAKQFADRLSELVVEVPIKTWSVSCILKKKTQPFTPSCCFLYVGMVGYFISI